MPTSIERLWVSGWLEKRETGYSMHPFIAECILEKPLGEKELDYLHKAVQVLEQNYGSDHPKVIDAKKRMQEDK